MVNNTGDFGWISEKLFWAFLSKMPEVMADFSVMEKKMAKNAFNTMEICNFASSMLQKDTIKLRAVELQDIDFFFSLENDVLLWHVSQTLVPFARFDLEQYVFSANKQDPFAAGQVRFVIELAQNNETKIIGTIDLFALDAINRRGGVGIVLLESYRRKSFAGTALDILIDYGFNFLNLHQLFCNIENENEASLKLFKSRRFEIVGVKKEWNRKNGKWVDENLLQLIAKD